ncbi:MAG: Ig-like domain-containing protein [Bacilli bacterium]
MTKRIIIIITILFILNSFILIGCRKPENDSTPRIELPQETLELFLGQTAKLTPVVKNTDENILWQTSNPQIATVDQEGMISAVGIGTVEISAFNDEVKATLTVIVRKNDEKSSLAFSATSLTVDFYDTLYLQPIAVNCDESKFVWTSSDDEVLKVESGVVTPHKYGEAEVTLTCGELSAKVKITVVDNGIVPTISYSHQQIELLEGKSLTLIPKVKFNGKEVKGLEVNYESLNEQIATVDGNGAIKGVSVGQTKIIVNVSYRGYNFKTKEVPVFVKEDVFISLSTNSVVLYTKEIASKDYIKTQTVSADVYRGNTKIEDPILVWTSSDENIVSVENGILTANAPGRANISVKYQTKDFIIEDIIEVEVILPRLRAEKIEIDLSKASNEIYIDVDSEFKSDTFIRLMIDDQEINSFSGDDQVVLLKADFNHLQGEKILNIECSDVVFEIPTLFITKSISTMDDLRSIATTGNVLSGYYVLNNDIYANNSDNFSLIGTWSNTGDKGFVGVFDGRGYGIYNINSDKGGLFHCIGATGIVKNLALVDLTTETTVIATECRGTIDNVFVTSDTGLRLIQMSDSASLTNSFVILSAPESRVVGTIFDSTCLVKNVYALAGGKIAYTIHSQDSEPSFVAKDNVFEFREEMKNFDFDSSGYDKDYWENYNGTPLFKSYKSKIENFEITTPSEIFCYAGQKIKVEANQVISIALKQNIEGVVVDNFYLLVEESAEVYLIATNVFGDTIEKKINLMVVEYIDRRDNYLFNYELGKEYIDITLPNEIESVDYIVFDNGKKFLPEDGYSVSEGKLTINKTLLIQITNKYCDMTISVVSGPKYYLYSCSFVTKIINSYEDLAGLRVEENTLDGYYILGQDIVADNDTPMMQLLGVWSSNPNQGFVGIFDGRGHSITNLKITSQGIFYCLGQSVIRNLALVNVIGDENGTVFGKADCQGTTFENVFVSSNTLRMFGKAFLKVSLRNVMFISSNPQAEIFDEGNNANNGSLTFTNVILVGSKLYRYYGGNPVPINTRVFASKEAMFTALASEKLLDSWESQITYEEGKLFFFGKEVLH